MAKKNLVFLGMYLSGFYSHWGYASDLLDREKSGEEVVEAQKEVVPADEQSEEVRRVMEKGPLLEEALKKAEMQKAAEIAESILNVSLEKSSVEDIRRAYVQMMQAISARNLSFYLTRAYEILISFKK